MKFCKHGKNNLFFLNGKKACPTCDVLLIDLEIECEEEIQEPKVLKNPGVSLQLFKQNAARTRSKN